MKPDQTDQSDHKRIEELEKRVDYLESILEPRDFPEGTSIEDQGDVAADGYKFQRSSKRDRKKYDARIPSFLKEDWLYWLGVGLLLLGVVFLFSYSVEQGWLIPPVRSAFGLLLGAALFWLGYSRNTGESIRQFLMGSGIGALYITGFATFQLYTFISYPVAFFFMIAVTVLSFGTSIRQNSATLSLIGTLGGLATPFLLYEDEGSLLLLMLYTCTIMTGAAAIYQFKKWGSLLWSMFLGGSLVLLVALAVNISGIQQPVFADRWTLQSSLIYMLGLIWLLPVVKELKEFKGKSTDHENISASGDIRVKENTHIQALTLVIPILAVQYTHGIWSLSDFNLGILAIVMSALAASICLPLRRAGFLDLSSAHMFSALVLFTQAMFLFFEGNMLLVVITLEALALRYVSTRESGRVFSAGSHILIVISWLLMGGLSLFSFNGEIPFITIVALTELFVLVATGLIIPRYLKSSKISGIYRLVAHIGMLAWLAKELTPIDNGQMATSVAWGVYAVSVLIAGFLLKKMEIRAVGMATILLVVGKLFFVDLSQTSALLRIPLFMGFGALFLLIGYLLQTCWSEPEQDDPKF